MSLCTGGLSVDYTKSVGVKWIANIWTPAFNSITENIPKVPTIN